MGKFRARVLWASREVKFFLGLHISREGAVACKYLQFDSEVRFVLQGS